MTLFSIEYDVDYGCHHRSGWSVVIDGSVCAELERFLVVALVKAWYCYWFLWDSENRQLYREQKGASHADTDGQDQRG
jgi:hypothetical protein